MDRQTDKTAYQYCALHAFMNADAR